MDGIRYPRKRFAEILALSERELNEAETHPELAAASARETFTPAELSLFRRVLARYPERRGLRKQLFLNFKGGTGKTSLSSSYAYRLAEMGHRVLIVDLDSQGHATKCVGYEGEEQKKTLFDVLVKKLPIEEVLLRTPLEELHLIPSNLGMSTIDLALMPMSGREFRLRKALEEIANRYDFVVMDAPPSFGLLNLNAIMAADDLFVPVLADFLSFHGLKLLFETVQELEEELEHYLQQIRIVLNAFNPTTKIAREARGALEEHYGEFLAKTVVRQCTKFAQSSSEGIPIFAYDPTSKGATDVEALIAELMAAAAAATPKERSA
ncbi:ParA family protein [Vulgatibacter incomptus]|uniref:Chromosome (Plasmid) partitioning protein ParA n=1 Tax=Vulgatibacter incomptus TaxID=1391653 RepID=A0A0K1PFD9_9BACT|nr:AAA family ATPase [Vulgatibacter incomptus]AKU92217.1 Chromosome (plasmid) partitioning protein ParA [Vulgatibacter incomptus]